MAKTKPAADDRRVATGKTRSQTPAANSMGIVVVDPAVKPRGVSVAKIRSAVGAITKR